jgi:UPF0716 protein FxsA
MGLILFFLFIAVPLIEIMLFIEIGGAIGVTLTIAIVFLTALIGSFLLRQQGLATLRKAQASIEQAELPLDSVIHGLFLVLAGAFLLTPGFLTDAIGFALFVPPIRLALGRRLAHFLMSRGQIHVRSGGWRRPGSSQNTIDGDAEEIDGDWDQEDR